MEPIGHVPALIPQVLVPSFGVIDVSRPLHPRSAAERVASGTCYTAHRPAGSGRGPPGIAGWLWGAWGAREAHGGRADRT